MPSARFTEAILSPNSSDCIVELLTLTHSAFGVLRYANGGADIISNGHTFTARGMQVALPGDSGDAGGRRGRASIDDVTRDLIAQLDLSGDEIGLRIDVVLTAYPNDLELSWPGLQIDEYSPGDDAVEITYKTRDDSVETFPLQAYTPSRCRGLFVL